MPSIEEAVASPTALGSDLQAGVEQLSLNQTVTFTRYVRVVLPLDGFVFWVKAETLSPNALYNAFRMGGSIGTPTAPVDAAAAAYNAPPKAVPNSARTVVAKGSLHYATDTQQQEQNTFAVNAVVFTSEQPVTELNDIAPNEMWLATIDEIRFAFSSRGSFYAQANLWHYRGNAVYSDMDPIIVDQPSTLNARQVVSNSLPAWLALQNYQSVTGVGGPSFPLFPSFLVPNNLQPPFAAIHIGPEDTRALGAAQVVGRDMSLTQLAADRVRVTLFGVRNDQAMDFIAGVNQYSLDTDAIGIMSMPIIKDDKRGQSELNALSIKKTIEWEVSYYQARMNTLARQLILEAVPTFYVADL